MQCVAAMATLMKNDHLVTMFNSLTLSETRSPIAKNRREDQENKNDAANGSVHKSNTKPEKIEKSKNQFCKKVNISGDIA